MKSVLPWSFSKLNDYETCPRRFYETKIACNFKETDSVEILWGNDVHKGLEDNVKEGKALPARMAHFQYAADLVNKAPGDKYVELELAVTADLQPTGFYADNAWARGKCDIVIINGSVAAPLDYKTGKKKPKSRQLDLMSAMIFATFPQVAVAHSGFIWLQFKSTTRKTYYREDVSVIWDGFRQSVSEMEWSEKNNAWPAKPSGLCREWCPVTSCSHNGKKR